MTQLVLSLDTEVLLRFYILNLKITLLNYKTPKGRYNKESSITVPPSPIIKYIIQLNQIRLIFKKAMLQYLKRLRNGYKGESLLYYLDKVKYAVINALLFTLVYTLFFCRFDFVKRERNTIVTPVVKNSHEIKWHSSACFLLDVVCFLSGSLVEHLGT